MKSRGKVEEKSSGCTYKSNTISVAKCPRVLNLVLNYCLDNIMFNQ